MFSSIQDLISEQYYQYFIIITIISNLLQQRMVRNQFHLKKKYFLNGLYSYVSHLNKYSWKSIIFKGEWVTVLTSMRAYLFISYGALTNTYNILSHYYNHNNLNESRKFKLVKFTAVTHGGVLDWSQDIETSFNIW